MGTENFCKLDIGQDIYYQTTIGPKSSMGAKMIQVFGIDDNSSPMSNSPQNISAFSSVRCIVT